MFPKPSVRLRFGAAHDDITVDGVTFVRHRLSKTDQAFVRNVVIDSLVKAGAVVRKGKGAK